MKALSRLGKLLLIAAAGLQLSACGTIFYPERRGQTGGRIDPGVAVLDAVGLLFFIVPGVIAFAVDFGNGTIYLPGGPRRRRAGLDGLRRIHFDAQRDALATVQRIVSREAGVRVDLRAPGVEVERLDSRAELLARFSSRPPALLARK